MDKRNALSFDGIDNRNKISILAGIAIELIKLLQVVEESPNDVASDTSSL